MKIIKIFGIISILIGLLPTTILIQNIISGWLGLELYTLYLLVTSAGFIISGIFILKLKNWARILFLILLGFHIPLGLSGLICFGPLTIIPKPGVNIPLIYAIVTLIIVVIPFSISLFFLTRKEIREKFK